MDCIFCEIANGRIPGKTVYEDDMVRAILDINPAVYGHTLVMPKTHADSLLECPDAIRDRVFAVAAALGRKMEKELGCDGVNVITNVRPGAGQSVMHFHVHVLPRYNGQDDKDALQIINGSIGEVDTDALADLLQIESL